MADIDLSTVPLAALTAEIKRRRDEWEAASKDLGFGVSTPPVARIQRAKFVSSKTGGNPTKKAAAKSRWAGWKAYQKSHPGAKSTDYWKARAAGKI